ncbi:MAG: FAS1-like dehydratase domain-containing protein [Candidatus Dormibacteria bacterium]
MAVTVGTRFEAPPFLIEAERVSAFARATGEDDPIYFDPEQAVRRGHPGQVAPPMFASTYCLFPVMARVSGSPDLGLDLGRVVHGDQHYRFHRLARVGESVVSTGWVTTDEERRGMRFIGFAAESRDSRGELVCEASATLVVRP